MTAVTLDVTIITGMSGAGRSAAADVLEDLGFFVIDNLPPALIAKVAELGAATEGTQQFALVVDVRSGRVRRRPRSRRWPSCARWAPSTRVLFLDAADDVLVRRYEATRRKHPLAAGERVSRRHRQRTAAARGAARARPTSCVDTTDLNVHELRDRLRELFDVDPQRAARCRPASCRSGTSTACPSTSTCVFDCRFLPNPHWVEELRPLPGTDPAVPRLRARSTRDAARSSTSSSASSRCCSPPTCARASRTSRSASAAPAVATAAS